MTATERKLIAWYSVGFFVAKDNEIATAYGWLAVTLLPLLLLAWYVARHVK